MNTNLKKEFMKNILFAGFIIFSLSACGDYTSADGSSTTDSSTVGTGSANDTSGNTIGSGGTGSVTTDTSRNDSANKRRDSL